MTLATYTRPSATAGVDRTMPSTVARQRSVPSAALRAYTVPPSSPRNTVPERTAGEDRVALVVSTRQRPATDALGPTGSAT